MRKIEVGQKLWWVPFEGYYGSPREVTVVKIGRKWATLSNCHRIELDSWIADGGQYSSPGSCYESEKVYEEAVKLSADWAKLRGAVDMMRTRPECVTSESIVQIRQLLGIEENQS